MLYSARCLHKPNIRQRSCLIVAVCWFPLERDQLQTHEITAYQTRPKFEDIEGELVYMFPLEEAEMSLVPSPRADMDEFKGWFGNLAFRDRLSCSGCDRLQHGYGLSKSDHRISDRLTIAAKLVSDEQDFSINVDRSSDDGIGDLTDAFNDMLWEIGTRNHELLRAR